MKIYKSTVIRPFPIVVALLTLLLLLIVAPISFAFPTHYSDYGDLPNEYNTLNSNDGAVHAIEGPYLGSCVDAESDGVPTGTATGDDVGAGGMVFGDCTGNDDEDGVTFIGDWSDGTGDINVTVNSGNACLNVWLDWGDGSAASPTGDGDFDVVEHVLVNEEVIVGVGQPFSFALPTGAANNATWYLRARLTPRDADGGCIGAEAYPGTVNPNPFGLAIGGEVEDYQISFTPTAVTLQNVQANTNTTSVTLIASIIGFLILALVSLRIVFSRRTR